MMKIKKIRRKIKANKDKINIKMKKLNLYKMIRNPIEKNQKVEKKLLHRIMKMNLKLMIFHHLLFKMKFNKVNYLFLNILFIFLLSILAAIDYSDESDDENRSKKKNKKQNKQKKGGKQQATKGRTLMTDLNNHNLF